ncbi:MAG: hypothetical protein PHS86_05110 [Syntrophaceae bacterium]|nr:hypothetical protein [Syntrophaceae bacterium]
MNKAEVVVASYTGKFPRIMTLSALFVDDKKSCRIWLWSNFSIWIARFFPMNGMKALMVFGENL